MKKITLLFLLIFFNAFSQEENSISSEKLTYTEVIQSEGISKDELYNRAKIWFVKSFNSAKDVIQQETKEDGQIVGKAIMRYNPSMLQSSQQTVGNIKYTISIYIKDGRYKYEISDFVHDPRGNEYGAISLGLITTDNEYPSPNKKPSKFKNRVWLDIKKQINDEVNRLISNLKTSMSKSVESKKTDW